MQGNTSVFSVIALKQYLTKLSCIVSTHITAISTIVFIFTPTFNPAVVSVFDKFVCRPPFEMLRTSITYAVYITVERYTDFVFIKV